MPDGHKVRPSAVALLALGEAGFELGGGHRGRPFCGRAQRVRSHDDALAVAGQHEHVVVGRRFPLDGGIEGVDVGRRAGRQLFHLALGDRHPVARSIASAASS